MASDPTKLYPLPKFHFIVNWGGSRIGFTEVSGLEFETEVIDYREGSDPLYNDRKLPGRTRYANITLKRGVFLGDFELYEWWKKTIDFMEQVVQFRSDIAIQLLNDQHKPVITWVLMNAWPCKVKYGSLYSEASEVLIESMELVHEGMSIKEAP